MYTINEEFNNTLIIKNSKFITYFKHINDKEDVVNYLNYLKEEHPKATHYCYAYIIDEDKKSSDDGEPSGTAGRPMLKVLEEENLNHVLCVVVRYFGGIKLGAGGLLRAYTKSVSSSLKLTNLITLTKGNIIKITFSYEETKNIDYLLKDANIISKEYDELITYTVFVTEDILNLLKQSNIDFKIIKENTYY